MAIPQRVRSLAAIASLALVLPAEASAAKDPAEYPLRVHVVRTRWRPCTGGFSGWGRGNIEDGRSIRGFDFGYECSFSVKPTTAGATYAGKWKKPGSRLAVLTARLGETNKYEECEFKTTMQAGVYALEEGDLRLLTEGEYAARLERRRQSALAPSEGGTGGRVSPNADESAPASAAREEEPKATLSLAVTSSPDGADIEVDGRFVGSTPSTIELVPGEHTVVVRKPGFKTWERKLQLTGGDIRVIASLEEGRPN
jgi:hypothetical protein